MNPAAEPSDTSRMRITVNPTDGLPIYRQIMQQIVDAIAGGSLAPGAQLPSHRELAQELVVAPLTIKKAYDELERSGHIRMQRGQGSFVADQPVLNKQQKLERLRPAVRKLVNEMRLLGIDPSSVRKLLEQELKAHDEHPVDTKPDTETP